MGPNRLIFFFLMPMLLTGCEFAKWLESEPDDLTLVVMVREEVERLEAERVAKRRRYIGQNIYQNFKADSVEDEKRFTVIEQKINALVDRMDTLATPTSSDTIALSLGRSNDLEREKIERLEADIRIAVGGIAQIVEADRRHNAMLNARFERLEFRTRTVTWPGRDPAVAHGLHLASYRSHEAALSGWEALVTKYPLELEGQDPILIQVETVAGPFVRLMTAAQMPDATLVRIRDRMRRGGDYAMIMPLRITGQGTKAIPSKVAPGS